jgi:hypothetical protein
VNFRVSEESTDVTHSSIQANWPTGLQVVLTYIEITIASFNDASFISIVIKNHCSFAAHAKRSFSRYLVMKLLRVYCEESSIHGFPWIVNQKLHFIEKILWVSALIASFFCCGLLIYEIGVKFQEDAMVTYTLNSAIAVTNVRDYSLLVSFDFKTTFQIPFAAVACCPDLLSHNKEFNYNQLIKALKNREKTIDNVTEKEFVNCSVLLACRAIKYSFVG